MLDLSSLNLEEIANAMADQTGYEHHWLINPHTGEIAFWTYAKSQKVVNVRRDAESDAEVELYGERPADLERDGK